MAESKEILAFNERNKVLRKTDETARALVRILEVIADAVDDICAYVSTSQIGASGYMLSSSPLSIQL